MYQKNVLKNFIIVLPLISMPIISNIADKFKFQLELPKSISSIFSE